MFNDNKNDFVAGIKNIINKISNDKADNTDVTDISLSKKYILLKDKLHKDLVETMKEYSTEQDKTVLSKIIKIKMQDLLSAYAIKLDNNTQLKLSKELTDDIVGLGILEDLLADETVTEIMVNGMRRNSPIPSALSVRKT